MSESRACHGVEIPWAVANFNTVQDACKRLHYYAQLMGEDHSTTDEYRDHLRDWIRRGLGEVEDLNNLADQFDAMEARQEGAEERLNDYRHDSDNIQGMER